MSGEHGGPIKLKPIGEVAEHIKNLLPVNIPEFYPLKPRFKSIASEEKIRKGVVAYRDFLRLFLNRVISDGHLYFAPLKKPKNTHDYPFLCDVADLLADIGYNGILSDSGDSILITNISSSNALKSLRFLCLCGFVFNGINLDAKILTIAEDKPLEVQFPDNPMTLTGLKALSVADIELRTKRYVSDKKHDNLLWCEYGLISAEEPDALNRLEDFLHPLPKEVQAFALALHRRYTDMGMTCAAIKSTFDIHFSYSYIKNSRRVLSSKDIYYLRVWEFSLTMRHGYCLVIKAKNIGKYPDVINKLPLSLREKIAKGYGCDRRLRDEPCQGGCQGFRIPLDDSTTDIWQGIDLWLDAEVSFHIKAARN
jgi:hypothetical protein